MAKEIIRTANAPAPPAMYSQAVRAAGLVFVSGTSPHDAATGKIVGETIQEQTRQCLKNIFRDSRSGGNVSRAHRERHRNHPRRIRLRRHERRVGEVVPCQSAGATGRKIAVCAFPACAFQSPRSPKRKPRARVAAYGSEFAQAQLVREFTDVL